MIDKKQEHFSDNQEVQIWHLTLRQTKVDKTKIITKLLGKVFILKFHQYHQYQRILYFWGIHFLFKELLKNVFPILLYDTKCSCLHVWLNDFSQVMLMFISHHWGST